MHAHNQSVRPPCAITTFTYKEQCGGMGGVLDPQKVNVNLQHPNKVLILNSILKNMYAIFMLCYK